MRPVIAHLMNRCIFSCDELVTVVLGSHPGWVGCWLSLLDSVVLHNNYQRHADILTMLYNDDIQHEQYIKESFKSL